MVTDCMGCSWNVLIEILHVLSPMAYSVTAVVNNVDKQWSHLKPILCFNSKSPCSMQLCMKRSPLFRLFLDMNGEIKRNFDLKLTILKLIY